MEIVMMIVTRLVARTVRRELRRSGHTRHPAITRAGMIAAALL